MSDCRFSMEKKCPTLSGRLIVLFVLMAALIIVSVGSSMMWAFRGHFEENIRPHLIQYIEYIQSDLGSPPDQDKAQALAQRLKVQIHFFSQGDSWSTYSEGFELPEFDYRHQLQVNGVSYGFGHRYDQEYLVTHHPDYTLAFSAPHKRRFGWLKLIPIGVSVLVLILLYYATRRLFAPIGTLKEGVERIGAGDLQHRIQLQRRDELGELSCSINQMADDIEQMLEAKRQLLLAISHELRSPLTRAKVSLALLEDESQQQEIRQDLNEMEALIEELLETERLSSRHHTLNKSEVELTQLIRALVSESFAQTRIDLSLGDSVMTMHLDQARIKLLLKNILDNAIKHNADDAAPTQVTLRTLKTGIEIEICDHGPGIEPQHLHQLTEPFYRTDAARQRQTGGYGLGLYLCKVITKAHGGELVIESTLDEGTCVTINLPLQSK